MKQGRSLQELAVEIQRQQEAKKDYLVETSSMYMTSDGNLEVDGLEPLFHVNDIAHAQIGQYLEFRLGITKRCVSKVPIYSRTM